MDLRQYRVPIIAGVSSLVFSMVPIGSQIPDVMTFLPTGTLIPMIAFIVGATVAYILDKIWKR